MKDHVMKCFATGFISHFEYDPPAPWGHVDNYTPLAGAEGEAVLRKAMRKEVVAGRMIGGPGKTAERVRQFSAERIFTAFPAVLQQKMVTPEAE